MTTIKNPVEIAKLLNSHDMDKKKRGYEAFLGRTHWVKGSSPEDLKVFACKQLNVNPRHVIASTKRIEPAYLWASQDGLESDKLKMVEAATEYFDLIGDKFPPIIVWNFYDSQKIRLIVHDGHHRSYYSHKFNRKLQAVILEPIGNYPLVEDKFRYAFQIRKRVIDLPVSRNRPVMF
jgi:hypothetical protein